MAENESYAVDFKEQVINIIGLYTHSPLALLLRDEIESECKEKAEVMAVKGLLGVKNPFLLGCTLLEYVFEAEERDREIDGMYLRKSMDLNEPFEVDREALLNEAEYIYACILREGYLIYFTDHCQTVKRYYHLVEYTQYLELLIEAIDAKGFFGFTDDMNFKKAKQVGLSALVEYLSQKQSH